MWCPRCGTIKSRIDSQTCAPHIANVVEKLNEAIRILIEGMGGHNHWDRTQRAGAGCEVCKKQREATKAARTLQNEAMTENRRDTT